MMTLTIENPTLEDYLRLDCNNDENKFISKIENLLENEKIKESIKKGLQEVKLQKEGKLPEKDISELLNKLD